MSWCWVFSSYPVQIYFPILHPNFGPEPDLWGLHQHAPFTPTLYCVQLQGSPAGDLTAYCLEAASLILPFICSPIYPPSFCLSLSLYPSLHTSPVPVTQWQLPPLSHSGHSGITSWYSLPQFTALSLLISISTYKIFSITLSSNYLISKCCIWFWLDTPI